jgi:hypothetical protein
MAYICPLKDNLNFSRRWKPNQNTNVSYTTPPPVVLQQLTMASATVALNIATITVTTAMM